MLAPKRAESSTNSFDVLKPKAMIEVACYMGYSAILFSDAVRRNGGDRYFILELNPYFATAVDVIVELAGLHDFVHIIVGRSDVVPTQIHHVGRCEGGGTSLRSLQTSIYHMGSGADVKLFRAEQKREAAKAGPSQAYNTTGMAERTVPSFTYNVGIVGYGFSAKIFHIPFVKEVPQLKLYAVVQRTPKPDDDVEKDHPGVKSFRTTEEMVQDPAIDVVIITTAPDSHFALSKLALEAGKHVVCEKPFTPTAQEADDLIAIAKKNNKQLAVFQNRRFDADFVTLSKLVKNGSLGRISEYETHFDRHRPEVPAADSHKWKNKVIPGGSAIYDLGTHLLDQAVHLLGLPKRVTGFIGSARGVTSFSYEDSFTVLLHYADGSMVTAKATVVSPEDEQLRFWVRGDKGSFKKYHLDIQEDQLKAGIMPQDKGYGREPSERYGTLTTIQNGKPVKEVVPTVEPPTYTEYYRKLVRALDGEGELPASGVEAREVIRLIELARESSSTGRTLDV
ncbi:uncharacterized protein PGRI_060280 [Penicillium griseofulvum]|uniref:Gfo/Idh/MocA-like oxidoreductase N-terminal domain-containing protein n=1 Tax=Penicillium patulum TaxID=5078 RepID=A0A135LM65_PENPA|nr:uncharacterized protein PGRI_060280 [Penicillium griseofulvum]KXG50061.1 hypothetical protein PGRI_060280 [Penicillium griseofulvum]